MITKTYTSEAGLELAKKMAFQASEESLVKVLSTGKAVMQIVAINTVDRFLLAKQAPVAADIVSDIMRTQDRKIAQYGETAFGFSEKQAAVIARDIIARRNSIV